jgi:hypothetical protein
MVMCALLVNLVDSSSVLWNRNYFLRFRFRFRLLTSYGSDFYQVMVRLYKKLFTYKVFLQGKNL